MDASVKFTSLHAAFSCVRYVYSFANYSTIGCAKIFLLSRRLFEAPAPIVSKASDLESFDCAQDHFNDKVV